MNFLKIFFTKGIKSEEVVENRKPENSKLIYLLNIYGQHQSQENYRLALKEIEEGNSFLILPSVNDTHEMSDWKTIDVGSTLKLSSVFNLDGLQVLGAFTDEKALQTWAKKVTEYTKMRSQDVIEFCKQNGIDRIVINSDQANMFVLERNRENIKTTVIEKPTPVQVGKPIHPLNKHILDKLITNFKKVDTILEAYHYAQSANNEFSLVIGVVLSTISDNSRAALNNAIYNSLQGEKLDTLLDIFVLPTNDWIQNVRNIQDSLFYKR